MDKIRYKGPVSCREHEDGAHCGDMVKDGRIFCSCGQEIPGEVVRQWFAKRTGLVGKEKEPWMVTDKVVLIYKDENGMVGWKASPDMTPGDAVVMGAILQDYGLSLMKAATMQNAQATQAGIPPVGQPETEPEGDLNGEESEAVSGHGESGSLDSE